MPEPTFLPNKTMVYVYRLPAPSNLTNGYCFHGGNPVTFENVDWFNGIDGMTREMLETEVRKKNYIVPGITFLVMSPENDISFTLQGHTP